MTATELQRIALFLSNSLWCRHFLHFNNPRQDPWLMAIQVVELDDKVFQPTECDALSQKGFTVTTTTWGPVYTIERTDDDGKPFICQSDGSEAGQRRFNILGFF